MSVDLEHTVTGVLPVDASRDDPARKAIPALASSPAERDEPASAAEIDGRPNVDRNRKKLVAVRSAA